MLSTYFHLSSQIPGTVAECRYMNTVIWRLSFLINSYIIKLCNDITLWAFGSAIMVSMKPFRSYLICFWKLILAYPLWNMISVTWLAPIKADSRPRQKCEAMHPCVILVWNAGHLQIWCVTKLIIIMLISGWQSVRQNISAPEIIVENLFHLHVDFPQEIKRPVSHLANDRLYCCQSTSQMMLISVKCASCRKPASILCLDIAILNTVLCNCYLVHFRKNVILFVGWPTHSQI